VVHETVRDYRDFDKLFRRHYETRQGMVVKPYDHFQPAYHYGYDLALNARFQDMTWERLEPKAQEEWEAEHGEGTWEEVKDSVQHAWRTVKETL
jgi:hypothetical protein